MDDNSVSLAAETSLLDSVLAAYRRVLDDPEVAPDDDFFELGGDSFQALDIMAALEEVTGKQVGAGLFYAFPTAAALARAIAADADS